jgi:hypothetical protein
MLHESVMKCSTPSAVIWGVEGAATKHTSRSWGTNLLDDLGGLLGYGRRDSQAERLGCPEVHHEIEQSRPFDRQVGRFGPFTNYLRCAKR